jgi:hypothetical protein
MEYIPLFLYVKIIGTTGQYMAVNNIVFLNLLPCSLVEVYQRYEGTFCIPGKRATL